MKKQTMNTKNLTPEQRAIWNKHRRKMVEEKKKADELFSRRNKALSVREEDLAKQMQEWGKSSINEELKNSREAIKTTFSIRDIVCDEARDLREMLRKINKIGSMMKTLLKRIPEPKEDDEDFSDECGEEDLEWEDD